MTSETEIAEANRHTYRYEHDISCTVQSKKLKLSFYETPYRTPRTYRTIYSLSQWLYADTVDTFVFWLILLPCIILSPTYWCCSYNSKWCTKMTQKHSDRGVFDPSCLAYSSFYILWAERCSGMWQQLEHKPGFSLAAMWKETGIDQRNVKVSSAPFASALWPFRGLECPMIRNGFGSSPNPAL